MEKQLLEITDTKLLELKAKLQEGKVMLGTEKVKKNLRFGKIEMVFLAKNCPGDIKKDLQHLAKLSQVRIEELELDNEELGVFCKKGFFISVLGTLK